MKRLLFVLLLAGLAVAIARKKPSTPPVLSGTAMGCRWTLQWRGDAPPAATLRRETAQVLETWEQVLSQWRADSDLSRHNRGGPASEPLARVIALSEQIKHKTGGAFDPHLLEKVHAAGFGPAGQGLDLSSIGKGFAVDRVCERLREIGARDFIFALAGEVRTEGGVWAVDIERPDPTASIPFSQLTLHNQSVATSGNYRQYRLTDSGIVSHIIDPRTGQPVRRPFSSVTVMAPDCATASAWATALFVLGPDFQNYPATLEVIWQP